MSKKEKKESKVSSVRRPPVTDELPPDGWHKVCPFCKQYRDIEGKTCNVDGHALVMRQVGERI
jgi:hypothetical protein